MIVAQRCVILRPWNIIDRSDGPDSGFSGAVFILYAPGLGVIGAVYILHISGLVRIRITGAVFFKEILRSFALLLISCFRGLCQYGISQLTSHQCSRALANCFRLSRRHIDCRDVIKNVGNFDHRSNLT